MSDIQQRALRLVTMSVGFRLFGPKNIKFDGHSTGLNENGLAGRCNLVSGQLPASTAGLILEVMLDLPKDKPFRTIKGEVLHISPSWVPGFKHFIALKFLSITPEDIDYLRQFIAWREADYFKADKPLREWYIYSTDEQKTYGPLTAEEIKKAVAIGGITPADMLWYPKLGMWMTMNSDELDENFNWIAAELDANYCSAKRSLPAEPAADPREPSNSKVDFGRVPQEESPSTAAAVNRTDAFMHHAAAVSKIRRAASSAAVFLALVFAIALWFGWADPTSEGALYRLAERQLFAGDRHSALKNYSHLARSFPESRLAGAARRKAEKILLEDLKARERQAAAHKLALLQELSEETRSKAEIMAALGDCHYRLGDYDTALAYFKEADEKKPLDGIIKYDLGTAALRTGNYRLALNNFARAVPPMGRNASFYLNAGLSHIALRQSSEAQNRFNEALFLSGNNPAYVRVINGVWENPQ